MVIKVGCIELFNNLINDVLNLEYDNDAMLDKIRKKTILYIRKCFGDDSSYLNEIKNIHFHSLNIYNNNNQLEIWNSGKKKLENLINTMIEDIELSSMSKENLVSDENNNGVIYNKVFIIHGHDNALKQEVARFIEKIGLEAIILHEQANKGRTIIEKFEGFADVGFAIALLTPDDEVIMMSDRSNKKSYFRARQNVIFEMGFFIGILGRERVFPLVKGDDVEIPSDYMGVVYTKYEGGNWKLDLIKELKAVGYDCDANKAF